MKQGTLLLAAILNRILHATSPQNILRLLNEIQCLCTQSKYRYPLIIDEKKSAPIQDAVKKPLITIISDEDDINDNINDVSDQFKPTHSLSLSEEDVQNMQSKFSPLSQEIFELLIVYILRKFPDLGTNPSFFGLILSLVYSLPHHSHISVVNDLITTSQRCIDDVDVDFSLLRLPTSLELLLKVSITLPPLQPQTSDTISQYTQSIYSLLLYLSERVFVSPTITDTLLNTIPMGLTSTVISSIFGLYDKLCGIMKRGSLPNSLELIYSTALPPSVNAIFCDMTFDISHSSLPPSLPLLYSCDDLSPLDKTTLIHSSSSSPSSSLDHLHSLVSILDSDISHHTDSNQYESPSSSSPSHSLPSAISSHHYASFMAPMPSICLGGLITQLISSLVFIISSKLYNIKQGGPSHPPLIPISLLSDISIHDIINVLSQVLTKSFVLSYGQLTLPILVAYSIVSSSHDTLLQNMLSSSSSSSSSSNRENDSLDTFQSLTRLITDIMTLIKHHTASSPPSPSSEERSVSSLDRQLSTYITSFFTRIDSTMTISDSLSLAFMQSLHGMSLSYISTLFQHFAHFISCLVDGQLLAPSPIDPLVQYPYSTQFHCGLYIPGQSVHNAWPYPVLRLPRHLVDSLMGTFKCPPSSSMLSSSSSSLSSQSSKFSFPSSLISELQSSPLDGSSSYTNERDRVYDLLSKLHKLTTSFAIPHQQRYTTSSLSLSFSLGYHGWSAGLPTAALDYTKKQLKNEQEHIDHSVYSPLTWDTWLSFLSRPLSSLLCGAWKYPYLASLWTQLYPLSYSILESDENGNIPRDHNHISSSSLRRDLGRDSILYGSYSTTKKSSTDNNDDDDIVDEYDDYADQYNSLISEIDEQLRIGEEKLGITRPENTSQSTINSQQRIVNLQKPQFTSYEGIISMEYPLSNILFLTLRPSSGSSSYPYTPAALSLIIRSFTLLHTSHVVPLNQLLDQCSQLMADIPISLFQQSAFLSALNPPSTPAPSRTLTSLLGSPLSLLLEQTASLFADQQSLLLLPEMTQRAVVHVLYLTIKSFDLYVYPIHEYTTRNDSSRLPWLLSIPCFPLLMNGINTMMSSPTVEPRTFALMIAQLVSDIIWERNPDAVNTDTLQSSRTIIAHPIDTWDKFQPIDGKSIISQAMEYLKSYTNDEERGVMSLYQGLVMIKHECNLPFLPLAAPPAVIWSYTTLPYITLYKSYHNTPCLYVLPHDIELLQCRAREIRYNDHKVGNTNTDISNITENIPNPSSSSSSSSIVPFNDHNSTSSSSSSSLSTSSTSLIAPHEQQQQSTTSQHFLAVQPLTNTLYPAQHSATLDSSRGTVLLSYDDHTDLTLSSPVFFSQCVAGLVSKSNETVIASLLGASKLIKESIHMIDYTSLCADAFRAILPLTQTNAMSGGSQLVMSPPLLKARTEALIALLVYNPGPMLSMVSSELGGRARSLNEKMELLDIISQAAVQLSQCHDPSAIAGITQLLSEQELIALKHSRSSSTVSTGYLDDLYNLLGLESFFFDDDYIDDKVDNTTTIINANANIRSIIESGGQLTQREKDALMHVSLQQRTKRITGQSLLRHHNSTAGKNTSLQHHGTSTQQRNTSQQNTPLKNNLFSFIGYPLYINYILNLLDLDHISDALPISTRFNVSDYDHNRGILYTTSPQPQNGLFQGNISGIQSANNLVSDSILFAKVLQTLGIFIQSLGPYSPHLKQYLRRILPLIKLTSMNNEPAIRRVTLLSIYMIFDIPPITMLLDGDINEYIVDFTQWIQSCLHKRVEVDKYCLSLMEHALKLIYQRLEQNK